MWVTVSSWEKEKHPGSSVNQCSIAGEICLPSY